MSMELDVWQGDWGLPSIDYQCLTVMAYCKFSDVPIKFNKVNSPWNSPSGELPILRLNENIVESRVNAILDYLRKQNYGIESELTTKQSADNLAFIALMEEKLLPAVLYTWWVDARIYVELTRPWYAKATMFPLSMYLPNKKHKDSVRRLFLTNGAEYLTETERENKIIKEAKECLNHLSNRLGNQDFFFGKSPTSLDAIVFGYLAPILKAPLGSCPLGNHLQNCPQLTGLCNRILTRYFPLDLADTEALNKKSAEEKAKQDEALEFPNKRRNMFIASVVALLTMMGYAFLTGLISVEISDVNENNEDMSSNEEDLYTDDQGDSE